MKKKILYKGKDNTYILKGESVIPLIRLMKKRNIEILTLYGENFLNRKSKEFSDIDIENPTKEQINSIAKQWSKVFIGRNWEINPHYSSKRKFSDFLWEFTVEELVEKKVLYVDKDNKYILKGESIIPLIKLMSKKNIKILTLYGENFLNRKSKEFSDIDIEKIAEEKRKSIVRKWSKKLINENQEINPYYYVEKDFHDFLKRFGLKELLEKGILHKGKHKTYILQGRSIIPLMKLMKKKNTEILTINNADYLNVKSKEFRNINIEELVEEERKSIENEWSNNLKGMNVKINPYYFGQVGEKEGLKVGFVEVLGKIIEITGNLVKNEEGESSSNGENGTSVDNYQKRPQLWYRGVLGHVDSLKPSLYVGIKNGRDIYERSQIEFFKTNSFIAEKKERLNEWDILCTMQHYGFFTRLLDWTEDPLMALSFAVRMDLDDKEFERLIEEKNTNGDSKHSIKAVVWVLNPLELNRDSCKNNNCPGLKDNIGEIDIPPNIYSIENHLPEFYKISNYVNLNCSRPVESNLSPPLIAFYGTRNNDRIISQRGAFTVFPRTESVPNNCCKYENLSYLQKVSIENIYQIKECRGALNVLGYNHYRLYPEMGNLSKVFHNNFKEIHN